MRRASVDTSTQLFQNQVRGFRKRVGLGQHTYPALRSRRKVIRRWLQEDEEILSAEKRRLLLVACFAITEELHLRHYAFEVPTRTMYTDRPRSGKPRRFLHPRAKRK
jgi:hypothetical protein